LGVYLSAIQASSTAFPYLDGSWIRAFDFEQWTYWGSSSDSGWGAWSVETGWSATWAAAGLGLMAANTTMWDALAVGTGVNGLPSGLTQAAYNATCALFFDPGAPQCSALQQPLAEWVTVAFESANA
jgi:hypothetical protein